MRCLEISNLYKSYGKQKLFDGASFSFPDKGLFFIVGDSGTGKSTLFEILSGIEIDYTGDVFFYGKAFQDLREEERNDIRLKDFGFIRQNYDLLELESVLENVMLPISGTQKKKKLRKRKALETLEFLGIEDKWNQTVNTLSGGEKQRVAIARALANDPKVILADEPTGALDKKNSEDVYRILKETSKKCLVIIVSHDLDAANRYGDEVLTLSEGKISSEKKDNPIMEKHSFVSFLPPKKEKISWNPFLWIKHAVHLFQAKKIRSLLTVSIVSFSLLALGLSLYVQRDLQKELNNAFGEWSGSKGIVMESNSKNEQTFQRIISANEKEIISLKNEYPNEIKDYGVNYLCSYENYFKDENEFYFDSFGKKSKIPALGVRNINEYRWLDELPLEKSVYPERPKVMENEQIVLSLPYPSMVSMCLALHIERSYISLGKYLLEKPLEILLETANNSWGYSDVQLFSLVGVLEENSPTIYQLNHFWNEYVLEDCMGFPTSDEEGFSLPWLLRKTYYILPRKDEESFFNKAREGKTLDQFVFERDSYNFDQTHNEKNKNSSSRRLYVFQADKQSLSYLDIKGIAERFPLSSYSVFGEVSYLSIPGAMVSGFVNPFFLGNSQEKILSLSEGMSKTEKNKPYSDLALPEDVSFGQYLYRRDKALTISSDFSNLVKGKKPTRSNEICLSDKLFHKFKEKETLYCAGVVSNKDKGDFIENDFRIGKLIVVGILKGEEETIYVTPNWSIDYWRDELGMSSFSLEAKSVVFHCSSSKAKEILPSLSASYPSMRFTDPSLTIESSINNVIDYVQIILRFASLLTLMTAGFLFLTNTLLLSFENKKEAKLFFELGIRRTTIVDAFGSNLLLMGSLSFFIAVSSLISVEFTLHKTLEENFGKSSSFFQLDLYPAIFMCFFLFSGIFVSTLFLHFWIQHKDFSRKCDF